jgi:hypothetical protein
MIGNSGNGDMTEIRTYTDSIKDEAELFAMKAFYKEGKLTENEVSDFFVKLSMIIKSIRRC